MADKEPVKALYADNRVVTENSNEARDLFNQSRYGILLSDGRVQLSFLEALYLAEKGKLALTDSKNKKIDTEKFIKQSKKKERRFWTRYHVFKDIRTRGYIIKTALKFGADFRVYDRGVKPGEDHAKWVVYPVHETETLTWHEFAAKNRVAHSTKKRLLIGVVDDDTPVILDLESIRVVGEGKFELDLVKLFNKKMPLIYKLEEGKYIIDLASTLHRNAKGLKGIDSVDE